jgi:hypothetical protein
MTSEVLVLRGLSCAPSGTDDPGCTDDLGSVDR